MAMKLREAIGLSEKLASDLSSQRGAWQRYLQTAARVYKYDFWEQLMIYGQRPNATACAEIELWNDRMGRRVNRGTCGIALIDRRHSQPRVRYVFDVADTHLTQDRRARTPRLWSIRPEQHEAVSAVLEDMFPFTEIAGLPFDEKIIKICELAVKNQLADYFTELKLTRADSLLEDLDDLNLNVRFRQLLENSVAYTVLTRCGLDADLYYEGIDFEYIFDFSTPAVISVLGRAVSDISRALLLELGGLARSVERGQKQRPDNASAAAVPPASRPAQAETKRVESQDAPAPAAQSNTDNEAEAGSAPASAVSREELLPCGLQTSHHDFDARTDTPYYHEDGEKQELLRTSDALRNHRAEIAAFFATHTDSEERGNFIKSFFNNTDVETILSNGQRAGYRAWDDVLTLWRGSYLSREKEVFLRWHSVADVIYGMILLDQWLDPDERPLPSEAEQISLIEQAEVEKASAFTLPQEAIDYILCGGSGVSQGKYRIYEQFQKNEGKQENINFLKNEYGVGGRSDAIPGSGYWEDHDGKGITISRDHSDPNGKFLLSWTKVEKRIGELIAADRYLNRAEKEQYPAYREQVQQREARWAIVNEFRSIIDDYVDFKTQLGEAKEQWSEILLARRCADSFGMGEKKCYVLTMEGSFVLPVMREAMQVIIRDNTHLTERCQAMLAELNGPLAAPLEPTYDELNPPPPPKKEYRFALGDTVYLGAQEYELLAYDKNTVRLFDPSFPIINKELSRSEFDAKIAENPLNDHLLAAATEATGTAIEHALTGVSGTDTPSPTVPVQTVQEPQEAAEEGPAPVLAPPAPRHRDKIVPAVLHPEIPAADRHEYHITDDAIGAGTPGERFHNNVRAICLLKKLEEESRLATPEEQEVLAKYVGWGGLADCFEARHSKYAELRALLTEDEYAAARASTLNAHYTTPIVIKAIYTALSNMGFTAGSILEPSCGIGNFFGCLPESMGASKLYGVELDSLTGRIAQQLYQNASITIQGYEKVRFPKDFFDLAVGNVPFGQYQVSDKAYDRLGFSIHNYFFAKALDQVRPGGIVAFLTSRYTLDSRFPDVRRYLAQRADLLGAIRLPNNAFKASAGTDVVADVIFLQKRDRPSVEEPAWVQLGENADGFSINRYFVDHPDMILGVPASESTQYGRQDFTVAPLEGADLAEQLAAAIQNIHGTYTEAEPASVESAEEDNSIPADPSVRNFSYTVVDSQVYYRENSLMTPVTLSVKAAGRVKELIGIRDCVRTLIEYQTEDYPESDIKAEQRKLNALYDAFVKRYGRISSRANNSAFNADSSYFLLTSLEVLDDEGNFVRKADMFTKRTIKRRVVVTHVDTASEALALSLSEKAKIDMPYMTELTGKTEEEIFAGLRGVIFLDPLRTGENDGRAKYLPADEYLSGNVREKLATARLAAENDPAFQANVEALEKVQPTDLTAAEISVRLGATWLPVEIVEQFMYALMDTPRYARGDIRVRFSRHTGEWNVSGKSRDRGSVNAYSTYGTARANGYKIIEETLNLRTVRIFDYVEDENGNRVPVLNKKETAIAQGKQELIKQAFQDWIWKDQKRRERLTRLYNEKFNSIRPREYDGSHLNFVGINPAITLRKHQVDAIAHILYGGNTLLAHVVGAGKTFEMVAAAMESKRLGLCQKSLFVVPNHLTEQWASEFLQLYPSANILVATRKDFETKNRKRFCGRIATGDYDAIIIGHSQFEKIPMSAERQRYVLEQQMDEIMDGIRELKENHGERFSIKQMERAKKSIEVKLAKLNDQSRKDGVVTFEELGVDRLFVDEAHSFKNLAAFSKMRNVGGISQTEAQKSSDLYMKCRYLDELTGGKGIVFATGTPISNTMVEMYTMQKYLQYGPMQRNDLLHFDAWASTFGETVTAIELAPEGTGYRAKTRFSRFYNLPELMSMFKEVADIQTADMLDLPVPKANYHNVVLKPSELQKEMVAALGERAEKVRSKMVDPSVDNMLKITNDGRKLALDQRLMNEMLPESGTGKVTACAENVFAIWRRTAARRSAQMVFCDLSTPHNDGHFNVYDAIRDTLTAMGIPAEEIAYIHNAKSEAQKKELFGKVRSGQIRVLIGSTQKMGAGTNVQQKLVALHHLDCPWRPADLQQREGRIIRQGNENPEVDIYTYVTENTFDSYLYQLVEGKQKFIGQIMTSRSPVRSAEDIDETALSYAEIKALCTGNPLIKERMDLDIDVQRLKLLRSNYLSQRYALEDKIAKYLPQEIRLYEQRIAGYEADAAHLAENTRPNADGFSPMTVEGKTYDGKKAAGSAILEACHAMTSPEPIPLGQYRGFDMVLHFDSISREYRATLSHQMSYTVALGNDLYGNITRIDNALAGIEGQRTAAAQQLENAKRQLVNAQEQAARPFPQEDELKTKSARLDELNIALNLDKRENEVVDDGGEELAMAS